MINELGTEVAPGSTTVLAKLRLAKRSKNASPTMPKCQLIGHEQVLHQNLACLLIAQR